MSENMSDNVSTRFKRESDFYGPKHKGTPKRHLGVAEIKIADTEIKQFLNWARAGESKGDVVE